MPSIKSYPHFVDKLCKSCGQRAGIFLDHELSPIQMVAPHVEHKLRTVLGGQNPLYESIHDSYPHFHRPY